MINTINNYLTNNKEDVYLLLRNYFAENKIFLLKTDIWDGFISFSYKENKEYLTKDNPLQQLIYHTQEATIQYPWIYFGIRYRIARWNFFRIHIDFLEFEEVTTSDYLKFKEHIINGLSNDWVLELDFQPFETSFPKLKESRSIGHGVQFLNKHLSSKLFQEIGREEKGLLEFLRLHQYKGQQLMLNQRIQSISELRNALRNAEDYLKKITPETTWENISVTMESLGFQPGWGKNVEIIRKTLHLLSDILEAPTPETLELFLSKIPMIFSIAIISPHGFFGQDKVLGLPDTGGQVIYILNQVKALENEMVKRLIEQGLDIETRIIVITRLIPESQDTTCNQRIERILGTKNALILRVPFRNEQGDVIPHWISRFEVWPYLERFSMDVEKEILAELGGRPDLIVGNYSDGNLVATLLSKSLKVTQCNIAHALEKTKYLLSAIYWKENEERYHFSNQFTADLIAMNSADFIITSTYQEIAGQEDSVGQYESYSFFTMPNLYRVVNGIDIFHPKFNIVSPGSNMDIYFPYYEKDRRFLGLKDEINEIIYGDSQGSNARGILLNKNIPIIFTMARLDRIKNITGLVEWYGQSEEIKKLANLLVIAGHVDVNKSQDHEEMDQINYMHHLFDKYNLDNHVRWLGIQLDKNLSGELYRFIADSKGIFVQPAVFEAFGLTVIESMISGLPTFATRYGGPLEIIENDKSGYHIDPNHGMDSMKLISDFFKNCQITPELWEKISRGGIERVKAKYTWELYADRMMTLSRIYGFWKFATDLERAETHKYLEMFYSLQYRKLSESISHS